MMEICLTELKIILYFCRVAEMNARMVGTIHTYHIIDLRTNIFFSTSNSNVSHKLNLLQRVSTIELQIRILYVD